MVLDGSEEKDLRRRLSALWIRCKTLRISSQCKIAEVIKGLLCVNRNPILCPKKETTMNQK